MPTPTAEGEPLPGGGKRHFVKPELVVSVAFAGWTADEGLRHPVFRGIREDLAPAACTAGPPVSEPDLLFSPPQAVAMPPPSAPAIPSTAQGTPAARVSRAVVTNRAKVFWPDEGYTKGELIDYYAAIAPHILPFLRDRPIVLVRYPDGIAGKSFYQWNVPEGTPSWIRTLYLPDDDGGELREKETKQRKHTFLVDDVDGLVHVANLGCIPIHVLPYRSTNVRESDYFVVDLTLVRARFRTQ